MRLLPAAVLLLTACAVTGCTTVSPARPDATTAPPTVATLAPPPAAPLLADVRPDRGTPSAAPAPPARPTTAAPRHTAPAPRAPRPVRHRPAGPASGTRTGTGTQGGGPCAMGRAYGHWPAGSSAATICQGVYGR